MLRQCPITSFGLENFWIFIFMPIFFFWVGGGGGGWSLEGIDISSEI